MPGIINSSQWRKQRRRVLEAELARDLPDDQRQAIEAELAQLEGEAGQSRRRWWRWALWGARPPGR